MKLIPSIFAGVRAVDMRDYKPGILDKMSPGFVAACGLFEKVGASLPELLATADENGLKQVLVKVGASQAEAASDRIAALTAEITALNKQVADGKAALTAVTAEKEAACANTAALFAGMASAGVRCERTPNLTAAEVTAAIRARASIMACDQLAT